MTTNSPISATGRIENQGKARAASLWLGYAPTGGLGLVLTIVLILILLRYIPLGI